MTVVVIGSINLDLQFRLARFPKPGETLLAEQSDQGLGGKGANQAIAAARMGAGVTMLGAVGCDGVGEGLVSKLATECVDVSAIGYIADVPTGTASIYLADAENMIVVAPGANSRYDGSVPQNVIKQTGISILVQLETDLRAIKSALNALGHAERVILNAAPAVTGGDRLFPLVDILVLNETELAAYAPATPRDLNDPSVVAQRAAGLLGGRLSTVIVTLGADGCLCVTRDGCLRVPAHQVAVVDSVGAGDCFCGALAAQLDEGAPLDRAVRVATAAASIAVQRRGAAGAMPGRAEVMALVSGGDRAPQ